MRGNRLGDHRTGSYAAAAANSDAVENDRSGANPAAVFDPNAARRDPLVHDRNPGIGEHMVDGEHLHAGAEQDAVADVDPALTTHDGSLADERPAANPDTSMRQVPEIEDMQTTAVQHTGTVAEIQAARPAVKIHAGVEIDRRAECDVLRPENADAVFDCGHAVRAQERAVGQASYGDSHHARNPAENALQELAQHVAPRATRLRSQVHAQLRCPCHGCCPCAPASVPVGATR